MAGEETEKAGAEPGDQTTDDGRQTTGPESLMGGKQSAVVDEEFKNAMDDELGYDSGANDGNPPGEEKQTTDDGRQTTEEDQTTEEEEEEDLSDDAKKPAEESDEDGELGELPAETKERIGKRIGKEVGKRKEAEESLAEERKYVKELEQKLETARTERDEERAGEAATARGVHPLFAAESEADLDEREEFLWRAERFCTKHRDDGYTGAEGEESFTKEQITDRLLEVREERERILPKAREVLRKRAEFDAVVKTEYPESVDSRSEMAIEMRRLMRGIPGLRVRADAKLMIADMIAGRTARKAKGNGDGKPKPKAKTTAKPKPGVPAKGTPGKTVLDNKPGKPKKASFDTFADSEFNEEALANAWD